MLASTLWACSDPSSSAEGMDNTGGALSTGGAPGVGGAPGTGAALGTGGTGTGGTGGSGGMGGVPGSGGATSTGGSSTGGAEGADFEPCPAVGPCKVLPLGDSITVGLGYDGGYRVELFRLALEGDHDITFLGTQPPNGPETVEGVSFPRAHEGISGQTIQQIADRIPSPGLTEMPHIILLHAGTNDMVQGAEGAAERLAALVDELVQEAPEALIVVSNIIPLPFAAEAVNTFNAAIPGIVQSRAEAGAHVVFVDQFDGFPPGELGDMVHPNEQGYERMAGKWFGAIAGHLR